MITKYNKESKQKKIKNITVDLIKATRYEENIVDVKFIKSTSNEKLEDVQIELEQKEANKEIEVYTEYNHLNKISEKTRKLYNILKVEY